MGAQEESNVPRDASGRDTSTVTTTQQCPDPGEDDLDDLDGTSQHLVHMRIDTNSYRRLA